MQKVFYSYSLLSNDLMKEATHCWANSDWKVVARVSMITIDVCMLLLREIIYYELFYDLTKEPIPCQANGGWKVIVRVFVAVVDVYILLLKGLCFAMNTRRVFAP